MIPKRRPIPYVPVPNPEIPGDSGGRLSPPLYRGTVHRRQSEVSTGERDRISAYLERIGRADTDGVHRKLGGRHCPRCHRVGLVGLDADVAALAVMVDPRLLTVRGEALATYAGRSSYSMVGGDEARLEYRDPFAIAGRPANRADVLVDHSCADGLPPDAFRPIDVGPAVDYSPDPPY